MPVNRRIRTARRFLDALCAGEAEVIDALMTDDMTYTDGLGYTIEGHAACSAAARAFHRLEPDYRFEVREITARGDVVMIRGVAHADNPRLNGEALLRGRVRGDQLCEWQVDRRNAPPLAKILEAEP